MFNMPDCQDQLPIVHQQLGRPARKESGRLCGRATPSRQHHRAVVTWD
jgi:hypothetical protein